MKKNKAKLYHQTMFCLVEMMKTLTPLFIEKIHTMTCIYTGTRLHQSFGKEGH